MSSHNIIHHSSKLHSFLFLLPFALLIGLGLISNSVQADDPTSADPFLWRPTHIGPYSYNGLREHPDGTRFTESGEGWPPQPRRVADVQLRDSSVSQARATQMGTLSAETTSELSQWLGTHYVQFATERVHRKNDPATNQFITTFVSYDTDITLLVEHDDSGMTGMKAVPMNEYQPPLLQSEVSEAINIAERWFAAQGNTAVAELDGYGILANPTQGDEMFHDHRVVYVSFHADPDARPEWVAWVDISAQTVLEGRAD